ncbi:MAG TPA: methionyl-tRNA formyltransferase [Sphingomicrobium sp.]|nr:methionyl-tRNA formyltransferase [Sphingomicrobium sp.]
MRVVFMGSPGFAVTILDAVIEQHEVIAAYCQPPRPAGRGKGDRPTPVHQRAEALGIPVRTPRSLRSPEEQAEFARLGADVAVVAAYGLILPKAVLQAPRLGCINVHGSLLPRWRGAAPVQRAIMAGDKVTGVTIMQMDEGLDTGPMLASANIPVNGRNAGELMDEIASVGAGLLLRVLEAPGDFPPHPQPERGVTYAAKITKAETRVDWSRPAREIEWQVRGLAPAPGAWFEHAGERVKLLGAATAEGSGAPGEVLDEALTIACGENALRLLYLQRPGRAPMSAEALLRGFAIPAGTLLA